MQESLQLPHRKKWRAGLQICAFVFPALHLKKNVDSLVDSGAPGPLHQNGVWVHIVREMLSFSGGQSFSFRSNHGSSSLPVLNLGPSQPDPESAQSGHSSGIWVRIPLNGERILEMDRRACRARGERRVGCGEATTNWRWIRQMRSGAPQREHAVNGIPTASRCVTPVGLDNGRDRRTRWRSRCPPQAPCRSDMALG